MQKMPKQKIFRKKWMQKNAIKENHDFSLILAKYSLILQKIRLHRKYFLSNIETRLILHTITPLKHLKNSISFKTKIPGSLGLFWLKKLSKILLYSSQYMSKTIV